MTCCSLFYSTEELKMAKKDKAVEEKSDKKKKSAKSDVSDKKGKKAPAPEAQKAKKVEKGQWDEETGSGGDFFKLPKGETDVLIRIRSVISVGQCVFEFNGKKDSKATSGFALVLECWPYEVKKDKLKLTSKEPAIVCHTMKALRGNKDAHWSAMLKELGAENPGKLCDMAGQGTIFTSDKGYMYLRKRVFKTGLAEKKATPELTRKGHAIPNLDAMTKEALLELNPITQVKDYVLLAANYTDSTAEELVKKIRKDNPKFATLTPKDEGKGGKGKSGKGASDKSGGKKKKKLDDNKEY